MIEHAREMPRFEHLSRLGSFKVSFRDWDGLKDAVAAARRPPLALDPWLQVVRGLKNNWKNLR